MNSKENDETGRKKKNWKKSFEENYENDNLGWETMEKKET